MIHAFFQLHIQISFILLGKTRLMLETEVACVHR
jgi:hypothetical protein